MTEEHRRQYLTLHAGQWQTVLQTNSRVFSAVAAIRILGHNTERRGELFDAIQRRSERRRELKDAMTIAATK